MTHPRPAHIHPKLAPFVYSKTTVSCTPITKTETHTVPGMISVYADSTGMVSVTQQSHTLSQQVQTGMNTSYSAVFEGPDGREVTFYVSAQHFLPAGTVIYLGIEQEYYVYQYEDMATPRMVLAHPPGSKLPPSLPDRTSGTDLASSKGQMDMRAASFPLRDYLARIGKDTPRTLLAPARLADLMTRAKTGVGNSYNSTVWPRARKDLPSDASIMERLLWPIAKYKPVDTLDNFGIIQKVSGEVNKAWLGGGLVLGTLANYLISGTLLQGILHTFGLNEWFYMGTLSGVLVRWAFAVVCSLVLLGIFMRPAIKKPFKFDEEAFFKVINTPYHPRARFGFWNGKQYYGRAHADTRLMSDAQLKDQYLIWAHQDAAFLFDSHADLIKQVEDTKLSAQERQALLDEIAATTPAY